MNLCPILNGYRERAVWLARTVLYWSFACGVGCRAKSKKKCGYKRPIACWHFGWSCQHTEAWRWTQTNNKRSSHMSSKVHWEWRRVCEHLLWTVRILSFVTFHLSTKSLYKQWQCFCVCGFKQLYLGNHSELDACSNVIFFSQWPT